jgi:hypothetical protein
MALTQAELDKLNAQKQAVDQEMLSIVTKTGVSAEQRAIDNARIKVLNKRAADIVSQQRSAQGIVSDTPSNPAPKPQDISTAIQNLSPNETDKLNALQTKKQALERKLNDPKLSNAEFRSLQNQVTTIQKEQDDLIYKGSKPPGEPLLNQQGANVGEPVRIPINVRQADASVAGDQAVELPEVLVTASRIDETDTIPDRRPLAIGQPLPNELHKYPSYTYGISLHLLTSEEYNQVVADQKYIPKRVLIASAGRYDTNTFPRSEFFNEDFYFEDLEIETIIGLNATSRNTNSIKIAFTIIEPYGFTLMERLIDSTTAVRANNYLDMPYLLEIDFFAHNDAGEIVGKLSDITKRIPIKLAAIDIKASMRGSEYVVQAYPYNHSAYDMTTISSPKDIEVVAGTISDFFASDPVEIKLSEDTDNATREVSTSPFGTTAYNGPTAPNFNSRKTTFSSYPGALNYFYRDLKNNNFTSTNDRYYFEFDPEILAGETFTSIALLRKDHAANKMVDRNKTNAIRISNITQNTSSDDFDTKKKIFSINAGTTIEKVISYVVRMSNYIQQQIVTPDDYGSESEAYISKLKENETKYLNWFKIVPIVRLGEWDSKKRVWQRDITYHVQAYAVKNVKLDTAPQLTADSPVKKYEYLYSGKNDDILDWDLHFNALYYNAMTVYKNSMSIVNNLGNNRDDEETKVSSNDASLKNTKGPNAITPMGSKPVVAQTQTTAGSDALTVREMAVADLEESLMTMSGADMLQVRLKIIGDPAYIKQDDIFYPPTAFEKITEVGDGEDQRLTPNGSIRTDYSEVYVQLTFRHPRDINENTSTMLFNNQSKTSLFSGLYKLLTVTSNFSQGAFTQTLVMIRLPNQTAFDYTTAKTATVERVNDENATDLSPNIEEADSTASSTPTDDSIEGSKAPSVPAEEEDPQPDINQKDLSDINANGPTQTIDSATAPQTTVPLQERISFNEAFRRARAANGGQPGGVFKWNDALYQTNIVGEEYVQNPTPVTYNTTPGNS